jgi:signal transduction histidine kinase
VKGREALRTPRTDGQDRLVSEGALAAAAHELKAPLVLIKHLAQSLADPTLATDAKTTWEYLQRIQLTADRSLRFVQHLTLSYRMSLHENGVPFDFVLEPLSINKVCTDALNEMAPYAQRHNQQLKLIGLHCPHLVLANQEILHDIVVNLVDNALQHNPSGSVVEVMTECRGEQVRLAVRDGGGNVTQHELKELRRNLGKQPQPLSGRSGTSGLGLYIVQQFAHAMGGSLGLGRSSSGTMFFVDLLRSKQLSLLP